LALPSNIFFNNRPGAMPLGFITELIAKPIKCLATGEQLNIDVMAVINPARAVHNTVQMVQSSVADKSSHVWVGRRALGGQGKNVVGLSLSPGIDVYHWAIAIEGFIYEAQANKGFWVISRDNEVESKFGKSFEWFRINEGGVLASRGKLASYADAQEGTAYGHGLGLSGHKNCQEFCVGMLARALGVSLDRATVMVAVHVGTALW